MIEVDRGSGQEFVPPAAGGEVPLLPHIAALVVSHSHMRTKKKMKMKMMIRMMIRMMMMRMMMMKKKKMKKKKKKKKKKREKPVFASHPDPRNEKALESTTLDLEFHIFCTPLSMPYYLRSQ